MEPTDKLKLVVVEHKPFEFVAGAERIDYMPPILEHTYLMILPSKITSLSIVQNFS